MGQYFKAINLDKRELVCPWCLEGGAKLWEWAVNPQGSLFTILLRKSSETGGGDYNSPAPQIIELTDPEQDIGYLLGKALAREGMPAPIPPSSMVGRWANDRVCLIGDYDASNLWQELPTFTNITEPVVSEWNQFIELESLKLNFSHCGCESILYAGASS